MKQGNLPPSWVLGTHFSRAVYYRSDTCIDASWLEPPWKPITAQVDKSLSEPANLERGSVCLASAPSLDVFFEQAVQQLPEKVPPGASDEGEGHSFSFPSTITCTSRVCDSAPSNFMKDTSNLFLPALKGEQISTLSATLDVAHNLSTIIDMSVSKPICQRSLSHNSLQRLQDGMQIYTPDALSPERSPSNCSSWGSSDVFTSDKPRNHIKSSQRNSAGDALLTPILTRKPAASGNEEVPRDVPVKRDMTRALSWSEHLSNATGNERAVLSAENWMLDLSQLLLGERFASGAYSRIYHGIYSDNPVAVKIIRQPDEDESIAERLEKAFMQEVNILSCFEHQNVVRFMAACKKPPVLCIVTEYLEGGSLRAFLHKRENELLSVPQVIQMALDIAYGMEYVHMKGVIHRDLKSDNLALDKDGCVKILDFGVSCFESACNFYSHDLGTYRWMAPEMLREKPYTRKVDVYSFGIVLWELLTAHLPYDEMGPVQAAFCVIHENARPPIPPNCPAFLGDLMRQCWSAEPEDRPEFWEILRVLNRCMGNCVI